MGRHTVRKRLGNDYNEGYKVHQILLEAMEEDGAQADGKPYYKYKKGWSDTKVGKETGYEQDQIERFRRNRGMIHSPKTYAPPTVHHFQPHGVLQKEIRLLSERVETWERLVKQWTEVALRQERVIEILEGRVAAVAGSLEGRIAELEETVTQPKQGIEARLGPNGSR